MLKHGTGALNIDGCRIEWPDGVAPEIGTRAWGGPAKKLTAAPGQDGETVERTPPSKLGRFPANLIHDGSDEVLECFPQTESGSRCGEYENGTFSSGRVSADLNGSSGSAARFFYTAKADADDRFGSRHPTVKPVDLIRYFARLITPPGGLVLDMFAGSGTLGVAAMAEGFDAILVEAEAEYIADIRERLAFYEGGDRHSMASKNRNKSAELTPLLQAMGAE